jgi:hypothetical protein
MHIIKRERGWRGAGQPEPEHICQEARDSQVWQARMKRPDPISALLAVEPFLLQLWEMSWLRHPNSQRTAKLTASSEYAAGTRMHTAGANFPIYICGTRRRTFI